MLFHRDPDFADAPETAQNGGFCHHHHFAIAAACIFSDFRPSTRSRPSPKASFAREYWLRNVAALVACCFAPHGHFLGLETGRYGHANARPCWRARSTNRRAKPATDWFPSTQTALDPGLVRLGRLGAVMATRVQNVQNGPKYDYFRLSPTPPL